MHEVAFCLASRAGEPRENLRAARGIERAHRPGAMNDTVNTATEEREQWRAKILRALAELRGDDIVHGKRRDEDRQDGSTRDG
jgi:hypothetical protein